MSEPSTDETIGHQFRTKTGTCTITSESIILTREGPRGAAAQALHGRGGSINRTLILYSLIGLGAVGFGFRSLMAGDTFGGVLLLAMGLYFLVNVIASRNNSAAPVIERSAIRSVTAHPPRPPATRGYFTVLFDEGGKTRKRLIILPGLVEGGGEEYKKAEAMMKIAGLLR